MAVIPTGLMGQIGGIQIFVNSSKTGAYVKRTWRERLFSWPWQPWISQKWDKEAGDYFLPDGQMLGMKNEWLSCNPITLETFKKGFPEYQLQRKVLG